MNKQITKDFFRYVSLNVFGMIGLSCYILADTFFIAGKLGAVGLAALNFALPLYCALHGTGLMLGIGGGSRFSIALAQGEQKKAQQLFTETLVCGGFFAVLFFLAGLLLSSPLSGALGAQGSVHLLTDTYLKTIFLFAPCFLLNNILIAFVRNDNGPKLAMAAMLTGSLSNIFLDWLFMFPLNWGIFGAAFATGLSPVISILVMLPCILRKKKLLRPVRIKIKIHSVLSTLSLGLSSLVAELSSGVVLFVFNMVISRLAGNDGVAAYGIIANIALVATAVFTGIAQGIQPLASRLHGVGENAKKLIFPSVLLSAALALCIYTFSFFFADSLIAVFNSENNPVLKSLAKDGVHIYFIGFLPAGINIILAAFLSATEKAQSAFALSISRGAVLLIPTVLLLSSTMTGVWLSFPITELLTLLLFCLTVLLFAKGKTKQRKKKA